MGRNIHQRYVAINSVRLQQATVGVRCSQRVTMRVHQEADGGVSAHYQQAAAICAGLAEASAA